MKRARFASITFVIFAAIATVAGCGAARQADTLGESVQHYNDSVRWGRFEMAAGHIPASQRAQRMDEWDERANDVKITDYEVVNMVPRGEREARVQIKVSWYKGSEGTVHETHAVQTWERHGKDWLMVDESRVRGSEMPGLPEHATAAEATAKD